MKRIMSIALVLALAFVLAACQGEPSSSTPEISSTPSANSATSTEESSVAQDEEPAEEPIEEEPVEELPEEEAAPVTMTNGENSVSILVGDEAVAEFTLPTETPIYDELKYMDDGQTAIMTHNIMEGVSGRTIVEAFEGTAEEYLDFYKSIAGVSEDAPTTTWDVNGIEARICQQETADDTITRDCLIAVPVAENAVLGFRIDAVSNPKYEVQFDDSVIDILLNHCVF